ncbi:hypothetical protein HDU97_007267 [Phlyctochytrium planicorne]|nr:hypothetical protein HDU97_007267 [Phlyctochytrium planicorne]
MSRSGNMSAVKVERTIKTRRSESFKQPNMEYDEPSQYGQNLRNGQQGSFSDVASPPPVTARGSIESSWKVLTKDGFEV